MKEKFTSGQRKTLLLRFLCYSAAYTGRLNLSAALPGDTESTAVSDAPAMPIKKLICGTGLAALLGLWKNAALCALLMGLCCAANFGVNPLLNALIPMDYDKSGRVGLVAGLIDCFIYIGSALTGVAAGAVIDVVGWQGVYAMWIVVSAIGAGFGIAAIRGEKCMKNQINV